MERSRPQTGHVRGFCDYLRKLQSCLDAAVVGDFIDLTIERNGLALHVEIPFESEVDAPPFGRHSGFPSAFIHDASIRVGRLLALNELDLGAPVIDSDGQVLGINIAITREYTYAMPATDLQRVVADLMSRASSRCH